MPTIIPAKKFGQPTGPIIEPDRLPDPNPADYEDTFYRNGPIPGSAPDVGVNVYDDVYSASAATIDQNGRGYVVGTDAVGSVLGASIDSALVPNTDCAVAAVYQFGNVNDEFYNGIGAFRSLNPLNRVSANISSTDGTSCNLLITFEGGTYVAYSGPNNLNLAPNDTLIVVIRRTDTTWTAEWHTERGAFTQSVTDADIRSQENFGTWDPAVLGSVNQFFCYNPTTIHHTIATTETLPDDYAGLMNRFGLNV